MSSATTSNKVPATTNFADMAAKPYPGRGFVIGHAANGDPVMVYWLMGRSPNSQNRVLEVGQNPGELFTAAADPRKVTDPSLIIYQAMAESGDCHVVSNGHQTVPALQGAIISELLDSLNEFSFEPDKPNWTPRITGSFSYSRGLFSIAVLNRDETCVGECRRVAYHKKNIPYGYGWCVTTYTGEDIEPLPSFVGEPLMVPLGKNAESILDTYWDMLNPQYRISLAVKTIRRNGPSEILIRNRFEKVAA
jgi:IMP cyclohydrolase